MKSQVIEHLTLHFQHLLDQEVIRYRNLMVPTIHVFFSELHMKQIPLPLYMYCQL
jgi:hypothetical protein